MHTLIKLATTHFYSRMNEGFLFFFFNSNSVSFIHGLDFLFQIKTKRWKAVGLFPPELFLILFDFAELTSFL